MSAASMFPDPGMLRANASVLMRAASMFPDPGSEISKLLELIAAVLISPDPDRVRAFRSLMVSL